MKKSVIRKIIMGASLSMLLLIGACQKQAKEKEVVGEEKSETLKTAENTEKDSETADNATEKHENRSLHISLAAGASTSDPFAHNNLNDRKWIGNVYEALFCYNGVTGEREPRVGKSVEISEDGITYRVEIFENIYFHNGKAVTAEDVKRSYEYAQTSAFNHQFSGVVDRVEVVSDYVVDIFLKEPSAPFLTNSDQIYILDMDEVVAQGEDFGTIANTAGTGAYYIEEYDPAVEIKLAYHEKFHRPLEDGKKAIPGVLFTIITDPSAADIAFESGDLDFLEVKPTHFKGIVDLGAHTTYEGQTTQSNFFAMNGTKGGPLANELVRKAIGYAINYDTILEASVEGYGEVVGKFAYPEMTIGAPLRGSNTVYGYDPEKAKALLKEAGYEDGVDIGKIKTSPGLSGEKAAQVIQENLADIGITVQLDIMEQVTMISDARDGNYDAIVLSFYMMMDYDYFAGIVDFPETDKGILTIEGVEGLDAERVFELFKEGRRHTDEDKRREIYTELDGIIMDSGTLLPLFHTSIPFAWDKDLYIETEKPYTYQFAHLWDCYWQ